jgi:hypothetical protein
MAETKVKLDKELVIKTEKYAAMMGYSSKEEFIAHCIEKEIAKLETADSPEEIARKLKGLGYIS